MPLTLRVIRFFQTTSTWLIARYLHRTARLDITLPFAIEKDTRYLFVVNHQSQFDPFAIFSSLSYQQMRDVGPTRFMTAGKIFYSYLWPFLVLCGCYPTRKKRDSRYDPVARSIYYLEHGQNVCIFPEGRRVLRSQSQPRSGVIRIIEGTTVPFEIILVHLEWTYTGTRRNLSVRYGRPGTFTTADELMQQLYKL